MTKKRSVSSEKKLLLFKRPWKHLGWACFYGWALATIYTPNISEYAETFDQYMVKRLVFACAMAFSYATLFMVRRCWGAFHLHALLAPISGIGGGVGSALFFIPYSGVVTYAIWSLGCVFVGICYVVNMTIMNSCLVDGGPQAAEVRLPISLLVAFCFYYAWPLMPALAAYIGICSMLPVGSFVYYFIAKRGKIRRSTINRKAEPGAKLETRFLAYLAAYCLVTGGVLGCVRFQSLDEAAPFSMLVACGPLSMIPVITIMGFISRPLQWVRRIDLAARFFLILGLSGLLAFGVVGVPIFNMNVFAAYVAMDLVMWYLNVALVSRSSHDPFYAVARAGMVQWIAIAVGLGLAIAHTGLLNVKGFLDFSQLVFGLLVLFLLIQIFVFPPEFTSRLAEAKIEGTSGESYDDRCLFLSEQFGLSKREAEVFALLARGRSASFICTELCISESTVKSHRSNIYAKLAINSKQALLDLVTEDSERA